MCGRFTLRLSPIELQQAFDILREPEWRPRFNIAPTQSIPAIRFDGQQRELVLMRWGLIPSWSKDERIGARLINARSETAHEKPSFRSAFKKRRCLIPADGFFEWKREGKQKQPYYFQLANGQPFAFAGLWETWQDLVTCTILTTTPNDLVQPLHDRMPVILSPVDYRAWLDPKATTYEELGYLFESYPANEMTAAPVNPIVNNARNDSPECIAPIDGE